MSGIDVAAGQITREAALSMVPEGKLLIGGKRLDASDGGTFTTVDPAAKIDLAEVAAGTAEDIDKAVAAARTALESRAWRSTSGRERGRMLLRLAHLIDENREQFAVLETLDAGKPIADSRAGDVTMAIASLEYYAGWADKIYGETVPVEGNYLTYTLREPVGVVGGITAWNFPLLLACWKLAPAIATGCSIVLKPAEQTPLSTIRLGELCQDAGIPDGIVNIVTGFGDPAGSALAGHMDVDKIAFTGSTEVGKLIQQASGTSNLKRVSLELGGKSPQVVFSDCDLDSTVEGVAESVYFNQGEICQAGSRVFVEQSLHDELVERLVEYSKTKRLGDTLAEQTTLGAIVSEEQYRKVLDAIDEGRTAGANVEVGGAPASVDGMDGWFVLPTVFSGVRNHMRIAQEEIFGPVISVIPFRDLEDVIVQANDTIYGLAANVWTRDLTKAHNVARAIKAGCVWINTYNAFDTAAPWGGYKQSGIGRELGKHALDLYTEVKTVWVQL